MKHIVMSIGSPVGIQNYSYKVDFALRGAAHVHGVLWLDQKNINALEKNDINQISKAFDNVKKDLKLNDAQKKTVTHSKIQETKCKISPYVLRHSVLLFITKIYST